VPLVPFVVLIASAFYTAAGTTWGDGAMRSLNLLFVVLINAVPLVGVKWFGWSVGVVLMLYWVENLLTAVFTCLRIELHRWVTRKSGHWRSGGGIDPRSAGHTLLFEYAPVALMFTLVHGIFVGAFTFMVNVNRPDWPMWHFSFDQFRSGVLQLSAVFVADFLVDALQMRSRSFAWIRAYQGQRLGRVLIMHLTIIFGLGAVMVTESPFAVLYVLIGLKTLLELASAGKISAQALPAEPPAWSKSMAEKLDKGGAKELEAHWQQERERMSRQGGEDEAVLPA